MRKGKRIVIKSAFRESLHFLSYPAEDREKIFRRPGLKPLYDRLDKVSSTDAPVLITGESGVGKEVIARYIHNTSHRRNNFFISLDLVGSTESLFETDIYGHEKGAFTSAIGRRRGKFELANGGTIFLDEICEIPLTTQSKLLRILETRSFFRVGGEELINTNFQLICATNKNIEEEITKGRFREELYFRINVIPIYIPPIREHPEDIRYLSINFLEEYCKRDGKPTIHYDGWIREKIENYNWPGNVRELMNYVQRIVVFYGLPPNDPVFDIKTKDNPAQQKNQVPQKRQIIIDTLQKNGWNKVSTAMDLSISRKHLYNLLRKNNISLKKPDSITEVPKDT